MKKWYARTVAGLFAVYTGGFFIAGIALPDSGFSELENRNLQQLPAFSAKAVFSGSFSKSFESYISDQFPARDGWVAVKSLAERAWGKQENNGIYIGAMDTLLERFEPPDEKRLQTNLNAVEQFAQSCAAPVYFSLIPTSAEIWSDRLPRGAPSFDQNALLENIQNEIKHAIYTDCYFSLWEHREEEIYYRTDHHWTTLGAYYVYKSQALKMGLPAAPLKAPETVSEDFYGTYFSTSGVRFIKPDTIEKYVPADTLTAERLDSGEPEPGLVYNPAYLEKKDKYGYFLDGNQALVRLSGGVKNGKKLLLIRDSYANCQAPFWTAQFEQVYLADLRYMKKSMLELVQKEGIDAVLVQYSTANFVKDTNLVFLTK